MPNTLVYGADGQTPIAEEWSEEDKMRALLIEVFGLLIGYNLEGSEYGGPSPKALGLDNTLKVIVDCVGVEALEKRYEGLSLVVQMRPEPAGEAGKES